jgi:hypothetical protein
VELLDVPVVSARVRPIEIVIVAVVPERQCGEFGAGKIAKGVEEQTIDTEITDICHSIKPREQQQLQQYGYHCIKQLEARMIALQLFSIAKVYEDTSS